MCGSSLNRLELVVRDSLFFVQLPEQAHNFLPQAQLVAPVLERGIQSVQLFTPLQFVEVPFFGQQLRSGMNSIDSASESVGSSASFMA